MKVIGLLSGTSADGIDVAICEIIGSPPKLEVVIIAANTIPYDVALRQRILDNYLPEISQVDTLCQLNVDIAEDFVKATGAVLQMAGLQFSDIDLIGSHGQTLWHNVLADGSVSATLQLGSGSVLAERTGITTINNFRERDVAAGGQGAPLTSYIDWLLLRHETRWRAIQNIGGIGNVTFLPPISDKESKMVAFDTGTGNVLIDAAVQHMTQGKQAYDHDGEIAASGTVYGSWLEELLSHPYYERPLPKTTGRELFGTAMAVELLEVGQERGLSYSDIIATLTAVTASSIAKAYRDFAPAKIDELFVGGGGRNNPVLMTMLRELLNPIAVYPHEATGIDSDYKEALVFAVLAYETWHNRPSALPEQTGAKHASVLGQITPGTNYQQLIRQTWGA